MSVEYKTTGPRGSRKCYHPFRNVREQAAQERDAIRQQRTPQQQLTELDRRLGENMGAKRERTRLGKQIADSLVKTTSKVVEKIVENVLSAEEVAAAPKSKKPAKKTPAKKAPAKKKPTKSKKK